MRSTRAVLAVVSVLGLGVAGCGVSEDAAKGSTDTINMSLNTDPATFDPALAKGGDDYTVTRLLFDTLVRKDSGNRLVGGIASKWKAVDAAHYTFDIRKGLNCSDGSALTPSVVARSLTRFASPKTGSSGRTLALGPATATFTADDGAGTVRATLSAPWADFLTGLSLPQAGIVCPAGLADPGKLATGKVKGAFSGPYTLASSQPAVAYKLALRRDYTAWPKFAKPLQGKPAENIDLTPITDYSTIATQLLSGSLDVGVIVDVNASRFDGDAKFTTSLTSNTTTYLMFNERSGTAFADRPDLRKAVAQAVDAQAFSDIVSGKRGSTISSVAAAKVPCVNTDKSLLAATDPAAAAKKLAGVRVHIVGTTLLRGGNDYIAEALRKAGATVKVDSLDNTNWATVTTAGGKDWDINVQGDNNVMGTLTSSLLRVMGPATEDGGRNKMGLVNDEGYKAVEQAMSKVDPAAQCAAFASAQKSFLQRVDAVPLSTVPNTTIVAKGFSVRAFDDYLDAATLRITE
ncbi:peptide/nickel transport system substrate-binding protein [Streptomyces sp. LBL]|uniref:ABC transporter substrate-binding protein n=1 Tax=Streptomyces sp. LBL TaxID=2940562 RepID=UPI002473CAB7|nr:ABC transporter substrate-binding protein [Streptomyces sp. LBL]MDH6624564.1 peptide/nickel transport system substrate-binding protein [Streptomyces sp. LBL]